MPSEARKRRQLKERSSGGAKALVGILLFFGVGLGIGFSLARAAVLSGGSIPISILNGSVWGAFGAWAIFASIFRARHALRKAGCWFRGQTSRRR